METRQETIPAPGTEGGALHAHKAHARYRVTLPPGSKAHAYEKREKILPEGFGKAGLGYDTADRIFATNVIRLGPQRLQGYTGAGRLHRLEIERG